MDSSFRQTIHWLLVAAILLFFWLALSSLVGDSPTMDEQNHLARGLAFLETGDPRLSLEHPPLVNSLSAFPVRSLLNVRLPLDDPSWNQPQGWYRFAELLLWEYNADVTRMIFLARLPIVWLTLGLALTAFHFTRTFARTLLGAPRPGNHSRLPLGAGLLAFGLVLFDPNILAHGRYTTTDLGGTAFIFLAAFILWRLWQGPGWAWGRLLAAALSLGLAFGSKLSTLVFGPIFVLLALLPLYGQRFGKSYYSSVGRRLAQLATAGGGALLVVWAIFAFQWGPFTFQYPLQNGANGSLARLLSVLNGRPGPMPTFWAGIEQIILVSQGGRPSFLLGQSSTEGFLAYFPVAFLTKTPLPTLLLLATAFASWLLRLIRKNNSTTAMMVKRSPLVGTIAPQSLISNLQSLFLLLPPLLYFLVSMSSDLNLGYRHLLPMLPFLYTFIAVEVAAIILPSLAGTWQVRTAQAGDNTNSVRHPPSSLLPTPYSLLPTSLLLTLFLLLLLPALRIHPHYLSYFNLLAGGPENGYNVLVDSNVDWGQDLLRLRDWMAENEVERVNLAWFGSAYPDYYGIDYDPLPGLPHHFNLWWLPPAGWEVPFDPASPQPGIYAISASNLWELPLQEDKHVFPWFRAREPDDRVGYSILIYEVSE